MKIIAAVDKNWAIGYKGNLLVSLPEDQKGTFRKYTLDSTVVYGRKTLETFPGQRLLPGRKNVIMSRNPAFSKEGAAILHSDEELRGYIRDHETEEIYIIGGEEVYRKFLPFCSEAIISKIDYAFESDAFFPNLDIRPEWTLLTESEVIHSEKGYDFSVCWYSNGNVQPV